MALSKSNAMLCATNVTNNTAGKDGGAIHGDESTINFTDMMFAHNIALDGAGVIHITSGSLNSEGFLKIMHNRGSNSAVNLEISRAMFSGIIRFENNYRSVLVVRSNVTFSGDSIFSNNSKSLPSSNSEGGALTILYSTVNFSAITEMRYNRAVKGGAIAMVYSTVYMHGDTTFECNTALTVADPGGGGQGGRCPPPG